MRKAVLVGSMALLWGCAGARGTAPVVVAATPRPAVASGAAPTETPLAVDPASTDTGSPRPATAQTGWIGAAAESDVLLAGDGDADVGIWVDAPSTRPRAHVAKDVALVIDTSGSMAGAKIDNARRAAQLLIDDLSDGDIVSIDTFADEAKTVVEPTVLSTRTRTILKSRLSKLTPTGSTDLFDGLGLGEAHVARAPATHAVRRVVVISDGIANIGPSSPEALGALAERGLRFHSQVTSLGVGTDYDEKTLDALALRSSGRLYHIGDPRELASLMHRELDLLSSTVATNAFVEVVPAPGVDIVGVEGCRSERSGDGSVRLPLGALFSGQRREALLKVRVHDDQVAPVRALASVRLHFRDPDEGDLERVQEVVARASFSDDDGRVARTENARTHSIMAVMAASELELGASQDVSSGQFAAADERLARAEKKLKTEADKATDVEQKRRLVAAAHKVASTRAAVAHTAAAPAPVRRNAALQVNASAMHDEGF